MQCVNGRQFVALLSRNYEMTMVKLRITKLMYVIKFIVFRNCYCLIVSCSSPSLRPLHCLLAICTTNTESSSRLTVHAFPLALSDPSTFGSQRDSTAHIRGKVRVTLRLAVHGQSVRLGDNPLETHDQ
jgi:hypothetical protein